MDYSELAIPTVFISMEDVGIDGFLMSSVAGTDLVARTAFETGWWSFERPLPAIFVRCAQHWQGCVLDIGSNTGFYSLLSMAAGPENRVVAFEPDPHVREILIKNAALNVFSNRIIIEPLALSDMTGSTTLFVPEKGHGLVESSSSLEAGFKGVHSEEITVAVSRLDDYLPHGTKVTLVKIDVEGHERSAVAGALRVLAEARPIIAIELLDDADYEFFNKLKNDLGYRSVALQHDQAVEEVVMAFDPLAWNHALVPEEKWDDFQNILKKLGLVP